MPTRKRRDIRVDAVFDLETQDWDTFVVGGILDRDGGFTWYSRPRERDMFQALLGINGHAWAHNAGGYDAKWFLDWLVKEERPGAVTASGSRIVAVRTGQLHVYDSAALTKVSLRDFTAGLGVEKQRLDLPCRCERKDCEGYCAIHVDMPLPHFRRVLEYLRADCESLMLGLERLREFAEENDIDLGATVGGAAWRNAQRLMDLPDADMTESDQKFARRGYFGGRTQLFRPESRSGWETDVNSMYPSRLATCALPCGSYIRSFGSDARRSYESAEPGIYRAKVIIPESHLPPLPVRTGERNAYPWGEAEGTWALPELAYAESVCGVEVEVYEAMTWERSEVVFKDWVDHLFRLRAAAPGGKKSPMGTFLKFYLNSLTGKLGSRPEQERWDLLHEGECPSCRCDEYADECECGAHVEHPDVPGLCSRSTYRLDACAHVEWAAYLTAEARVEWHRQATSEGDGLDLVYGDTDGMFVEKRRTRNLGNALGQWEDTGPYRDFRGVAPKVYTFVRDQTRKLRAKGCRLPKDPTSAESDARRVVLLEAQEDATRKLIAGAGRFDAEGLIGFRAGVQSGRFFKKNQSHRTISVGFGDRILTPAGYTRAPRVSEIFG
jgi:hypothetical protein